MMMMMMMMTDDDDDDGNCKMTEFEEDIEDLGSVDAGSVKLGGR